MKYLFDLDDCPTLRFNMHEIDYYTAFDSLIFDISFKIIQIQWMDDIFDIISLRSHKSKPITKFFFPSPKYCIYESRLLAFNFYCTT